MRFKANERIGRFKIQGLLAPGGFGEAYLALDTKLERLVVIKCVRADLNDTLANRRMAAEFHARFWVEARGQARVTHPNVCTVFEVDEANELLVLEYIDGRTLEDLRQRGEFSKQELIDCVIGIAEAVVAAHEEDVIHRDLTLKNVMMTESKQVKVLDFGLAKLRDEPQFTQIAGAMGTRPYMSPEQQLRPVEVDERTDIFSLGVLIYRLVTQEYPYKRSFKDDPDPDPPPSFSDLGRQPWAELNLLVRTALELKPEDRFQKMSEMLNALRGVRDALTQTARSLHCFDTSTLFEVICPPVGTNAGLERWRRARDQFEVHHAENRAVASPEILAELLTQVSRLYFEAKQRGLAEDPDVQSRVTRAKKEIRRRWPHSGPLDWDGLSWDQQVCFLQLANPLFLPKLDAMASQLSPVVWNAETLYARLTHCAMELCLPQRDSRVLAGVFSVECEWLFSEERRYKGREYQTLLQSDGPNRYKILRDWPQDVPGPAAGPGAPRRRSRRGGSGDPTPATESKSTQSLPN